MTDRRAITTATPTTPMPRNAQTFDARRFGGPIGELVARRRRDVLADIARARPGAHDPGRRHRHRPGRVPAGARRRRGHRRRRVGADARHRAPARGRSRRTSQASSSRSATRTRSSSRERSFDVAVSLRVLMHTPRWRQCIAELCRVAGHAVVLDYPSASSTALVAVDRARSCCIAFGRQQRAVPRVLRRPRLRRELESHGFRVTLDASSVRPADRAAQGRSGRAGSPNCPSSGSRASACCGSSGRR